MATQGQAVVRGEHDERVLGHPVALQRRQDPSHLGVQVGDEPPVLADLRADHLGVAGPGRELLVAARHPAVVKRVERQEVPGQGHALRGVPLEVRRRRRARVVGRGEGHPGEEGTPVVRGGAGFEELDRGVGEQLRREARLALRVEAPVLPQVLQRHALVVAHPAEKHRATLVEAAREGLAALVPLAGPEGRVAGLAEPLGQRGDAFEVIVDAEELAAAEDHGPARRTHRPVVRAHDVGLAKAEAAAHEPVQVGRLDVGVTPCRHGVGALVVAQEDEDVGARSVGGGCRGRREGRDRDGTEQDEAAYR